MKKRTLAHENDWYYNNYIMRLLIVEDENDLRNIVKKRLVKEHYSVDACGDGLEAMDYIDMIPTMVLFLISCCRERMDMKS